MKKILITSLLALAATTSSFASVKGGKFGMDFAFNGSLGAWTVGNGGNSNTVTTPNTAGTPTVGFWYHITDMIAVAPHVGFYTASYTNNPANSLTDNKTEKTTTGWALGLEVPIYLLKLNQLDFFVAPGIGYTPVSTTTKVTTPAGVTTEGKGTGSYLSIYAAVGLQVPVNDQLHFFGKTTIGYASGTEKAADTDNNEDKATYFGLQRWAVGAIFYFN